MLRDFADEYPTSSAKRPHSGRLVAISQFLKAAGWLEGDSSQHHLLAIVQHNIRVMVRVDDAYIECPVSHHVGNGDNGVVLEPAAIVSPGARAELQVLWLNCR